MTRGFYGICLFTDESFCRCPIGMQGDDCDKATDANYDILFFDRQRAAAAHQAFAFELNSATREAFTIGLWVRFTASPREGTFFSLYGLE